MMIETIKEFLSRTLSPATVDVAVLALIAVVSVVAYCLAKAVLYMLDRTVKRTSTTWDDDLLNHRFLRGLAQLVPALLVNWLLPQFFDDATALHHWTKVLTLFYIVWAVVHVVNVTLTNLYYALARRPALKSYAVKGVFQMCKLVSIGLGVIVGLSIIIGKTPLAIITAIGASAAVLMLVFRDTILGLVASVQLTANEMLHKGDWIVAPKYDVNGEVTDVSLTTVKVRNWDNSISTIPPYSLVSDSFRNYQAMRDIGGRRVDRSVLIDFSTIRFLSLAEITSLVNEGFLPESVIPMAASIANVGLLRRYLEHYLKTNPLVNTEMLYMVREMEPTPTGLPLQIYFFTPQVEWKAFEGVQSDIMDHVYASVRKFHLSIYQAPAGSDIARLSTNQ
ncbi:MAG: mechanosensitive ion channel family protein [Firmicutes bacterium]|nr:mechanosensitive ion channel family protein [Bacillota bacterium]MCM1400570.1 mechanosensitive ion channel family protein [Bacteroides sp.]MCM1476474.1 mechanosensitive ion channel family protein [Bacteroides sp.]